MILTKDQQRALRILFYFYTPQVPDTIPEDVKKSDEWRGLGSIQQKEHYGAREKLWKQLEPLIGADSGAPAGSRLAPSKGRTKKK